MADEYISREAAIDAIYDCFPECRNKGMAASALSDIPDADVAPVVRCKDCVYWQKPQVWQNDGTYRDYFPGEIPGMVTIDVGVNIGSFCAKYNTAHQNRIPQFMGPDDYCSKGYRAKMDLEESK